MSKEEIVSKYNNLIQVFDKIRNHWTDVTGDKYCFGFSAKKLTSTKNISKSELEENVSTLEENIKKIQIETIIYKKTEIFKSSKIGSSFISKLKEEMNELKETKKDEKNKIISSFNTMLCSIGMSDWKIEAINDYQMSFNFILSLVLHHKVNKNAHIRISIVVKNPNGYCLKISCGSFGEREIGKENEQYLQFKGYVTLHDSHEMIYSYLNKEFHSIKCSINDINKKIQKIENEIYDPYISWINNGHTDDEIIDLKNIEI